MKFLPLVWAMLWRRRARTWLTFLSITVAFFLFGLLQTILALFGANVRLANADNLFVSARSGLPLPIAYRQRIEAVSGVIAVSPIAPLDVWYQDPKNRINAVAADPLFLASDRRIVVPPQQVKALQQNRTGIVVGRDLARQHGWKLGDRIPLQSAELKKDGSSTWEFEIDGIFEFSPELGKLPALNVFVNYDYFDEARYFDQGQVLLYIVRIKDPARSDAISAAIDGMFRNSPAETKTQTESMANLNQANEFADMGLIVHGILSAVFFTLALVAGNTMVQAFRERISELAVMKTIGFGDGRVAGLIVAEALLLTVGAGAAGLMLAVALVPTTFKALGGSELPPIDVGGADVAAGVGMALALGLVAALIPAWKARRLTIIEALAGE